jgi:hypothetical protein
MPRRTQLAVSLAILCAIAGVSAWNLFPASAAGQNREIVREILARSRVFPEIRAGVRALKRDSSGRYYVLAEPATVIYVYAPGGKRSGQIPNASSGDTKIVYAEDIDVDSSGRLFVADRGANAVKIFKPDGSLDVSVRVSAPTSLAALPGNEFAIASLRADRLVSIYDERGTMIRSFGDPTNAALAAGPNRYLSHGRLSGDPAGFIYFAFTYLPDATIRKYDRFGYAAYEISIPSPKESAAVPTAPGVDIDIHKLAHRNQDSEMKPVINAIGVDPASSEVWLAMGDELVHFDKDGGRIAAYRAASAEGARLEPSAILVESDRILLAEDRLGVFEFARPAEPTPPAAPKH